ncbi:tyrosine-type recombinase/integrase [Candidatus Bathyarchaeota archaeon]|nr:tyrosine-type recombinase/integrase [Candidatus Bathyarchaeota archaeon]
MKPYRFTLSQIEGDPTVQRMFLRRSLREETRSNYVKGIRFFCEFFGKPPRQLIEELSGLSQDELLGCFEEFFAWAKNRVASTSCWKWMPGVRAWLVENGVRNVDRISREISREFKRKFGGVRPLLKRDVLSKDEIIRLLKIAPLREKAIISAMASGGFRLRACLNLQMKHFKDKIWDPTLPCYAVEIPETLSKEGEPYITFISNEAGEYIRKLLTERLKNKEKIGPESYVFVTARGDKPLSSSRFENLWRELCDKAGLDLKPVPIKGLHVVGGGKEVRKNSYRYNTRIHALRKFFKTACSISGVDRMASETFMGHSLTKFGVESLYDFCTSHLEWLRDEYLKVLPAVTFLKMLPVIRVVNHEARERIERLEEENRMLREKIERIERILEEFKKHL